MVNLRCFLSILPLLASIWLTSLNIFTLGGFGCLTPYSLMWVSSSSLGGLNKIGSLFSSFLGLAYLVEMSNFMAVFALCILGWTLLSWPMFLFSTSHALSLHPWWFSRLMTRIRRSLCSRIILPQILSITSVLFVAFALVLSMVICTKIYGCSGI